jgi:hypothetical protein
MASRRPSTQNTGYPYQTSFGSTEVEGQILTFVVAQLIKPLLYERGVLIACQGKISHAGGFC